MEYGVHRFPYASLFSLHLNLQCVPFLSLSFSSFHFNNYGCKVADILYRERFMVRHAIITPCMQRETHLFWVGPLLLRKILMEDRTLEQAL